MAIIDEARSALENLWGPMPLYIGQIDGRWCLAKQNGTILTEQELDDLIEEVRSIYLSVDAEKHNRTRRWHNARRRGPVRHTDSPGVVYIAKCNGAYKIGLSKNPQRRLKDIEYQQGSPVKLIYGINTEGMFQTESALHHLFYDKRIEGEWFDLSEDDLEYIAWIQREGLIDD